MILDVVELDIWSRGTLLFLSVPCLLAPCFSFLAPSLDGHEWHRPSTVDRPTYIRTYVRTYTPRNNDVPLPLIMSSSPSLLLFRLQDLNHVSFATNHHSCTICINKQVSPLLGNLSIVRKYPIYIPYIRYLAGAVYGILGYFIPCIPRIYTEYNSQRGINVFDILGISSLWLH